MSFVMEDDARFDSKSQSRVLTTPVFRSNPLATLLGGQGVRVCVDVLLAWMDECEFHGVLFAHSQSRARGQWPNLLSNESPTSAVVLATELFGACMSLNMPVPVGIGMPMIILSLTPVTKSWRP